MILPKERTCFRSLLIAGLWTGGALAQSTTSSSACPTFSPAYPAPVVAAGWQAQLIATGLSTPRSILFDSNGHLLVVQSGQGVVNLELADNGGICVSVAHKTYMINSTDVSIHPPLKYIMINSGTSLIMALPYQMMAEHFMHLPRRPSSRGHMMQPRRLSAAKTRP